MVGKNHVRAIADEQIAVNLHAVGAEGVDFLDEGKRVEHHAVADYSAATLAKHTAWNELQDKLLTVNGNCVSGIVATRIARHHLKMFGENVNDLALAFIAPLRADD